VPALTLSRRTALLLAAAAIAAVLVAARLAGPGGKSAATVEAPVAPAAAGQAAERPAGDGVVVVDVAGAVRRPGLYRLRPGARIADALARAGGAARRADIAAVNLAEPLVDGEQVLVPARAGPERRPRPSPATRRVSRRRRSTSTPRPPSNWTRSRASGP
jgi:competence protein ComEA